MNEINDEVLEQVSGGRGQYLTDKLKKRLEREKRQLQQEQSQPAPESESLDTEEYI